MLIKILCACEDQMAMDSMDSGGMDDDSLMQSWLTPIEDLNPYICMADDITLLARRMVAEGEEDERKEAAANVWNGDDDDLRVTKDDRTMEWSEIEAEDFTEECLAISTNRFASYNCDELQLVIKELADNSIKKNYVGVCRLPIERWSGMKQFSHSLSFNHMEVLCYSDRQHLQWLEKWSIQTVREVSNLNKNKTGGGEPIKSSMGYLYFCWS